MKNFILSTICALGLATGAQAATATFDFVDLADNVIGEGVVEGQSFENNGLTVTVTSSHFAYLDADSGLGPAGLGVCQTNVSSCGSDDNVTAGEWVTLSFSHTVSSVLAIAFSDATHNSLPTGGPQFYEASSDFFTNPITSFTAIGPLGGDATFFKLAYVNTEFYLSSITFEFDPDDPTGGVIPLPAGLPLMLGALGILGLARRKKKA